MGQNGQLDALADRLSEEQLTLSRMEAELRAQASRVAELELVAGRSDDFPAGQPKAQASDDAPRRTVALRPSQATLDRNYWLRRCEGFLVESPTGIVGVVVGSASARASM